MAALWLVRKVKNATVTTYLPIVIFYPVWLVYCLCMIKKFLKNAVLASAFMLPLSVPAAAQVADGVVTVDVLPGWRTENDTHMTALRVRLAEGWKTYWRAPGDSGIPPRFDWTGSRNIGSVQLHWPRPSVFDTNGLRTIGYKNEVVIPLEFTPNRTSASILIRGQVELGVCASVCVPVTLRLNAELGNELAVSDPVIQLALNQQPTSAAQAQVSSVLCQIEPIEDGLRLTARITMPSLGRNEVAVFELPDQTIWISEASAHRAGSELKASVDMVPPNAQPFSLNRSDVRITVLGADSAVDIQGCQGS